MTNTIVLRKIIYCLLLIFSITLISCSQDDKNNDISNNDNDNNITEQNPEDKNENEDENKDLVIEGEYTPQVCPICSGEGVHAKPVKYDELPAHTPTEFKASSVNKTTHNITNGVDQHTYTFKKNNDTKVKVVVTEVNLKHAKIVAGTNNNAYTNLMKTTIYEMASAFEAQNPNKKVVAGVNGDFFGGAVPVNAFVKDGTVIKAGHNDNGRYENNSDKSDIPASMPMLFGVSGEAAQINPIIKNATTQETIQSQICRELTLTRNGKSSTIATEKQYVLNYYLENRSKIKVEERYNIDKETIAAANSTVLTVKLHGKKDKYVHGEVIKIENIKSMKSYKATKDYYYVMIPKKLDTNEFKLGDIISHEITSADGTWAYYDQIIGCRHALVIDGQIPSTVSVEETNGAKRVDVPRTAVGVMPNGNVVLISVEALNYGTHGSSSDTRGLSLVQLADFMRYIGVYSGANLDGGGSTQLISRENLNSDFKVLVRSSDTGSTQLNNSRVIANSILVYVNTGN